LGDASIEVEWSRKKSSNLFDKYWIWRFHRKNKCYTITSTFSGHLYNY